MYGVCTGPRSLRFRGRRPIPRLRELASSSARPAAALRDFREEDYALAVDAIVAEVQMRDGSVRFEHVAERLDTGNVFPDCHNLGAGTLKNRWIGF